MPKGPKGQKRPADAIGAAIAVAKIATGEEEDTEDVVSDLANPKSEGGKRRAATLSAARRKEIARKAAKTRWQETTPAQQETKGRKEKTSE